MAAFVVGEAADEPGLDRAASAGEALGGAVVGRPAGLDVAWIAETADTVATAAVPTALLILVRAGVWAAT